MAAQAIRGSALFSHALPILERHAPRDIVVALGVLWEDQIIYIYHPAGFAGKSGAGGVSHVPGPAVGNRSGVTGGRKRRGANAAFYPEQWRNLAPHVAQQRQRGYVLWHHADGEVSMAQPLDKHAAALAFAGMWRIDEAEAAARLQALKALNQRIAL